MFGLKPWQIVTGVLVLGAAYLYFMRPSAPSADGTSRITGAVGAFPGAGPGVSQRPAWSAGIVR